MSFRVGEAVDKLFTTHTERKLLSIVPNYLTKVCALIIVDFLTEERFICDGCDYSKPLSWKTRCAGRCEGCRYHHEMMAEYDRDARDDRLLRTGEWASYSEYQSFYDSDGYEVLRCEKTPTGRVFQYSLQDSD